MADGHRPRVLVLEDEWVIAELIQDALEEAGFEVVGPAGRISQALALLENQKCDAAVLDMNLHGEHSFRVAEELAARSTPFVFVSGYSTAVLPPAFIDRPLMQKPVETTALCRCIATLLADAHR